MKKLLDGMPLVTNRLKLPSIYLLPLFALFGAFALPTSATAAVDTFQRFEENAQANWVVTSACGDGAQAQLFVTVIGGLEFESPNLDEVNTFATVLIRGRDCEGNFINDRGSGPATYTSSPSLQTASVSGTVPLRSGSQAMVNVMWEGTGPLETSVNQTVFPGFVGLFINKQRDAVATGTVGVDGQVIVSGEAQSADIETLEDRNRTLP